MITSPALGRYLQLALASTGLHSLTGVFFWPIKKTLGQVCAFSQSIISVTFYPGGFSYIFNLFRSWSWLFPSFGATGLTLIAFFELVSVMYVYGHKRFTDDIENMTGCSSSILSSWWPSSSGVRPGPYWQIMWRFISPALMSAVIASSIYFLLTNNPKYSAWNKEQVRSSFLNGRR